MSRLDSYVACIDDVQTLIRTGRAGMALQVLETLIVVIDGAVLDAMADGYAAACRDTARERGVAVPVECRDHPGEDEDGIDLGRICRVLLAVRARKAADPPPRQAEDAAAVKALRRRTKLELAR
jgi:hypothetical protein